MIFKIGSIVGIAWILELEVYISLITLINVLSWVWDIWSLRTCEVPERVYFFYRLGGVGGGDTGKKKNLEAASQVIILFL